MKEGERPYIKEVLERPHRGMRWSEGREAEIREIVMKEENVKMCFHILSSFINHLAMLIFVKSPTGCSADLRHESSLVKALVMR